jgi:uncharacterized phage-like protein YoqJ
MGKICSFFGHRKIEEKEKIREKVSALVEKLLLDGFTVFLFGGFGEFDELCHEAVSGLKGKYSMLKRVYCLSDEKHLIERKRPKYLTVEDYEEFIYLPPSFDYWYKRIYYRNCEMIEKSDFIVFYAENRENSGAYKAFRYAVKQKKNYINLF